jgi:hypothetical protein
MFELAVCFLCICNLECGERKDFFLFATIFKNFVQVAFLCFIAWVMAVITSPELSEGLPLSGSFPFCWYTKGGVGKVTIRVNLGVKI